MMTMMIMIVNMMIIINLMILMMMIRTIFIKGKKWYEEPAQELKSLTGLEDNDNNCFEDDDNGFDNDYMIITQYKVKKGLERYEELAQELKSLTDLEDNDNN